MIAVWLLQGFMDAVVISKISTGLGSTRGVLSQNSGTGSESHPSVGHLLFCYCSFLKSHQHLLVWVLAEYDQGLEHISLS